MKSHSSERGVGRIFRQNRKMRKIGKEAKTSGLMVFGIIGLLVIGGIIAFATLRQSTTGGVEEQLELTGDCETAPTIDIVANNGVNKGSIITGAEGNSTYVNDVLVGSTIPSSLQFGDSGTVHIDVADYLGTKVDFDSLKCGINVVTVDLFATDDSTLTVFNTGGNQVTDTGTTVNESQSANPITMEVRIDGKSDQSSGDLTCVIEGTNTTQIDDMVIANTVKTDVPQFYTVNGALSITKAYEVPALIDGASIKYPIKITPETGQTLGGTGGTYHYLTCYSKQWFVQPSGELAYGVEDSDGTAKYEDDFDYQWGYT